MKRGFSEGSLKGSEKNSTILRRVGDGSSAISSFAAILNDPTFSDVTFVFEHCEYHAHRAILAARSEVFFHMLFNGMSETFEKRVPVADVDATHFFIILQWAYTGTASMSASDVLGVLRLATFYNFPDLEVHCRNLATGFIDVPNVLCLLHAANEIGEERVTRDALLFLQSNGSRALQEPSWLTVGKRGVEQVLSLETFDCSESILFSRLLDWIEYNCEESDENRRSMLQSLLPLIRLSQMDVHELLTKVKPVVKLAATQYEDYVDALEYKLSPSTFLHYRNLVAFQPRTPTLAGRITHGVSQEFLLGWRLVVDQDASLPIYEKTLASIDQACTTYIAVGMRQSRASATDLQVIAVGRVDVALRMCTSQTQFYSDGTIYWCCNIGQGVFGFAPTSELRPVADTAYSGNKKCFASLLRVSQSPVDASGTPTASSGVNRFIYVK